jgi:hypothetical protein
MEENCRAGQNSQRVVVPREEEPQYSDSDHFWERNSKNNVMVWQHTEAITCP